MTSDGVAIVSPPSPGKPVPSGRLHRENMWIKPVGRK